MRATLLVSMHEQIDGPIYRLNRARPQLVDEVVKREFQAKYYSDKALEYYLNDTAFREIARLEQVSRNHPKLRFWRDLYRSIGKLDQKAKEEVLKRFLTMYAEDIVGSFDPKVYRFTTSVVPVLLSGILRPQRALQNFPNISDLTDRLYLSGDIEALLNLAKIGTIILVPTHCSHLDSVMVGYSAHQLGLPPLTYGAGKNLFTNQVLGFFMHNLGAYKVDRRITHQLYKDTLKTYSTVLLEQGYHSLFFPGGTRSRDGSVETKLKLGLLGTGLTAYTNNLLQKREHAKVFIVPCNINYHLVLEGETLIDDFLKREGKSRYIIEDDEASQWTRVLTFVRQMLGLDYSVTMRFGTPLDPFGNRVLADGTSVDYRGRPVDPASYVLVDGTPTHLPQRDQAYTKELGEAIAQSFLDNNMPLSTNVLAFALFQGAEADFPHLDFFRLLRLPPETAVSMEVVYQRVDRLRQALFHLSQQGKIVIADEIGRSSVEGIVANALRYFSMYHPRRVARRRGDYVLLSDMRMLYYYQNRLKGYDLERIILKSPAQEAGSLPLEVVTP